MGAIMPPFRCQRLRVPEGRSPVHLPPLGLPQLMRDLSFHSLRSSVPWHLLLGGLTPRTLTSHPGRASGWGLWGDPCDPEEKGSRTVLVDILVEWIGD